MGLGLGRLGLGLVIPRRSKWSTASSSMLVVETTLRRMSDSSAMMQISKSKWVGLVKAHAQLSLHRADYSHHGIMCFLARSEDL